MEIAIGVFDSTERAEQAVKELRQNQIPGQAIIFLTGSENEAMSFTKEIGAYVGGVMGDAKGEERQRPAGHPYLRLTRMLEPGVVVTVEPGIYFIDSLLTAARNDVKRTLINWDVVDELRPFGGVRIEDNVVTTASAPENMTRDAFKALRAHPLKDG